MSLPTGVDGNRVATYIRWSTDEQTDGTTLEVQLEACRHFVQSQGWLFREDLTFIDDGYSGGSMDRPGLARLRNAVADGLISCVVVYKLDRLSRSVLDTVTLVLQEWEGICSVRSTREPIDTSNPAGSILFYMLASYAEWERSTIKERTMSGKIKRAQQGKCPGFVPPYGYSKGPEAGQWVINEPEAVIVRRIFREYITGRGIHQVAASLNADGIRPRRAAFWRPETIINMITNPVYTGVLRYGMSTVTTKAQRKQVGKFRVFFDEPRFAYVEGAVPALIAKEDFERAQRVKESRNTTQGCRARGSDFLLTGIARCRCGATIRGDGREKQAGKRYYRCSQNKIGLPTQCACGLMSAPMLEEAVLTRVREALAPGNRALLLSTWQADNMRKAEAVQAEIEQIQSKLLEANKKRARFTRDYNAGDLPAKLYAAHIEQLDQETEAMTSALESASGEMERLRNAECDLTEFEQVANQLDSWELLGPEEQKQLLRYAIARCVVYRTPTREQGKAEHGHYAANHHPIEVDLEIRQIGV